MCEFGSIFFNNFFSHKFINLLHVGGTSSFFNKKIYNYFFLYLNFKFKTSFQLLTGFSNSKIKRNFDKLVLISIEEKINVSKLSVPCIY